MARTTVSNTIQRIRRQAAAGYRNEINILANSLDATETTITLTYDLQPGLQAGAVLCIGLETMRVLSTDEPTKTVVVIRGWLDSDGATHTAGEEVLLSPRYPPLDIYDAMVAELQSWGPQLYRPLGDTLTVAASSESLELPVDFIGIYGIVSVRRLWTGETNNVWPDANIRVQRAPGLTWDGAGTSGVLIRFIEGSPGGSVYVIAAAPFTVSAMTYSADLVTAVGMQESQLDVLEMGVKLRLGMDNESNRTNRTAQDEPRRAEETPIGAANAGFQLQNSLYRNRKAEEIMKLRTMFPIRYT